MRIHVQRPVDQPTGTYRLMEQIRVHLQDEKLDSFRFIVAFAKLGPFLRLEELIKAWRANGKTIEAVFGVDEKGTSLQALEFAMEHFSSTHIANFGKSSFSSTFHPKVYQFMGAEKSYSYIGSNNFTVGGLETNSEAGVGFELDIPADAGLASQLDSIWDTTIAASRMLDLELLEGLQSSGLVVSEREMLSRRLTTAKSRPEKSYSPKPEFPALSVKPPSPLPRLARPPRQAGNASGESRPVEIVAQAFLIQIVPHPNGEVFLSKIAVNQNPEFFGYPFQGRTTPKKATNQSYPQRDPDPLVSIVVYDASDSIVVNIPERPMNTVYYETKSEVRVTFPPEVIKNTPPYSIMLMNLDTTDSNLDYNITIFAPDSSEYRKYLADCNQEMPAGGKEIGRRFGWV